VTEQHLQELIKQRSQRQTPQTGQAMAQSGTEGNTEPDAEAEEPADDEEDA
jgi:hypothetical protein